MMIVLNQRKMIKYWKKNNANLINFYVFRNKIVVLVKKIKKNKIKFKKLNKSQFGISFIIF